MDCKLPDSSIHGIFQARVLEWVAISSSRGSSKPRDWTQVCRIAGRRFTIWATREARLTLWDPINCIVSGSFILHYIPEFSQFMSIESEVLTHHLILYRPLQLFPASDLRWVGSTDQMAKVLPRPRFSPWLGTEIPRAAWRCQNKVKRG